jgi:rubrerythrin
MESHGDYKCPVCGGDLYDMENSQKCSRCGNESPK